MKDRLDDQAIALSDGQQQRLCLARSLALEPEVILLDEPTSGLDPISTAKVEASLQELKKNYTVILVPHSVQQAARAADYERFADRVTNICERTAFVATGEYKETQASYDELGDTKQQENK